MITPNGLATAMEPGAALDPRSSDNGARVPGPGGLGCLVIGTAEQVHVVALGGDAAGQESHLAASLETLATLLERTAAALRGSDSSSLRVLAPGPDPAGDRRAPASERLVVGQLEIHPATRLVLRGGEPVPLSRIEFDLFLALVRHGGRPTTRLELVREVWGYGAAVTSRSVDTQIYNLRHKLEENPSTPRHILTVSGVGYRLAT